MTRNSILAGGAVWRAVGGLIALAAVAATAGPAAAFEFFNPQLPYSGERLIRIDGKQYRGRVWHRPGLTREELDYQGTTHTVILNFRGNSAMMLLSQAKMAVEVPLDQAQAMFSTIPDDVVGLDAVAQEQVFGVPTTRYKVVAEKTRSDVWVTDEGIVMKLQGIGHGGVRFDMVLRDLRIGPQDTDLFEMPGDYQKMFIRTGSIRGLNLQELITRMPGAGQ